MACSRSEPRRPRSSARPTPGSTTAAAGLGRCNGWRSPSARQSAAWRRRATAPLGAIAELSGRAAVRAAVYAGEHQSAELLQRAYLPTSLSPLGDVSFASRYLPAGEPVGIGGDWYDLLPLPDGRIGVAMGDVAGHGFQAAVVMASLRGALRAYSTVEECPAGILSRLNDFTCLFKPDAFATVFVGLFEAGQERIRYARAGHPPPLLVSHDGSTEVLNGALGPPLGFPGATYEPAEEAFPVGMSLVAYTDGLIERRDESIESRQPTSSPPPRPAPWQGRRTCATGWCSTCWPATTSPMTPPCSSRHGRTPLGDRCRTARAPPSFPDPGTIGPSCSTSRPASGRSASEPTAWRGSSKW